MTPLRTARANGILTIDYEDWFHILELDLRDPGTWEDLPTRIEEETWELLGLLDRYGAHATFFVLGWLARRTPEILREVVRRGHRLGSHSYYHRCPDAMSESEFRGDLLLSVAAIEEVAGVRALGYRAPGFRVRNCSFSYLNVLRDCGFLYDSSVFPGLFPARGHIRVSTRPHCIDPGNGRFWEVPVSAVRLLGIPVVFSGGGFLRLMPAWFVRWSACKVADSGTPVVYYLHPRDMNPEGFTIRTRRWKHWRYYGGRRNLREKFESILRLGPLGSVEDFLTAIEKDGDPR